VVDTGDILLLFDSARMRTGKYRLDHHPQRNLGKLSSITIFTMARGRAGLEAGRCRGGSGRYLGAEFGMPSNTTHTR